MSGNNRKQPRELISPSVDFITASERIGLHWWYWNNREHRLTVSPGLLRVLGYTEKDFDPLEPSIYKNIHPDDASENQGNFRRLLDGETSLYEMEYRVKNRQGAWEWYYNRGSVIEYDPEGKPLVVGGISMNISDRFTFLLSIMKDNTSGKLTEAALRESEKLYRTLFESADDRIALLSREEKFILVNSAFYQSIGYTREEFLQIDRNEVIHPDDIEKINRMNRELLSTGTSNFDYRIRHRHGHWLHMSSKNVLIPGETLEKDLILSITRDVTEQRKILDELEIAKQRAEESDRLKSAFLANMSHEIRTPMNSIVGFSYMLVNPDLDEATREEYVHRIIRNSETLLALISDIIDLARIESGQLVVIYDRLDLSTLMKELHQYALDEIRRLNRGDLDIVVEKGSDPLEIDADMVRVTQVMKNLINNAIKFTPKGQVKIGYRRKNEEMVLIFVEDTGIGIDPGHFDLIFEQFRQIDESNTRRFGGTGLGLSISRDLVEMMGGKIGIASQPGKGSLFQVELPVRRPAHTKQQNR